MQEIKFNWVGFFLYSDEEHAYSHKLPGKVNKKIKMRRLDHAIAVQRKITSDWLYTRVGKCYDVVIDDIIKNNQCILARSPYEAPDIDGNIIIKYNKKYKIGESLKAEIIRSFEYDLEGKIHAQNHS